MKFRVLAVMILAIFITACSEKKDQKEKENAQIVPVEPTISQNLDAAFSVKFIDGDVLSMSKKNGGFDIANDRATLFFFFASWCPPCLVEIPLLNELQKNFKDSLEIIGVVINDPSSEDEIKNFLNTQDINFKVSLENEILIKAIGGIDGIPYMFLYDKDGNFDRAYQGIIPLEMLTKDVERVVK